MATMANTIDSPGLGPKKTFFIMVTVVGCIAILWPKVFYPMMFSGGPIKNKIIMDHRGSGCCDVVLDTDKFSNVSQSLGQTSYRKRLNLLTGEVTLSIRQERPPHLRPDSIHPAMRERGRAIPTTQTIPIVEKAPPVTPRIVEGRPGPIPGMRPPMGAGSLHQPQPKSNTMGFVMPLYTIGIVSFFIYTIMKIVFKKSATNTPYVDTTIKSDPEFHKQVFNQELPPTNYIKRPDDGTTKLVVTAIQGLVDAADEHIKRQSEKATATKTTINKDTTTANGTTANGTITTETPSTGIQNISNGHAKSYTNNELIKNEHNIGQKIGNERKKRERSNEKEKPTVKVLGMEMTASCEGGQKWVSGRPPTPILFRHHQSHPPNDYEEDYVTRPTQQIYLEGSLPHESKIIVTDAQTRTELIDKEADDDEMDEPAVVLSSKMTLSLISLDPIEPEDSDEDDKLATNNIITGVKQQESNKSTAE